MFPAVYFYRKDRIGRLIGGLTSVEEQRLSIPEMLLLLAAGAGFAQYANVLVAILQNWISSSYGETMTKITSGKSLFMMIFWMGDHSACCRRNDLSLADLSATSGSLFCTVFRCDLCGVFSEFITEMSCRLCMRLFWEGFLRGFWRWAVISGPVC